MAGEVSDTGTQRFRRGSGDSMHERGETTQHGKPAVALWCAWQQVVREGKAWLRRVAGGP